MRQNKFFPCIRIPGYTGYVAHSREGNPLARGPGRPVGTDSSRTREHLLEVARNVLSSKGFPKTTIREIADQANVNPALLHYYFGNKSGLHTAVVEQMGKQMQTSFEVIQAAGGSASERLRHLIRAWLVALAEEPYVPRMMIHYLLLAGDSQSKSFLSQAGTPLVEGIATLLGEGVAQGEFREFDPAFLVTALTANCLGLFLSGPLVDREAGSENGPRGVIESWADSVADLILHGLLA